jgi:pimeloyl-ACP methyl ester carboxylesterase
MPIDKINGVNLYWEIIGDKGEPLVLIHGSWVDHNIWKETVSELAKSFRVLIYDRRGHSQSERLPEQGNTEQDVSDLIALLNHVDFLPAHIAGNSFGASIALKTAVRQPDLFKSLIGHEPPLLGLLKENQQFKPLLQEVNQRIEAVASLIAQGENEKAAKKFVETIAFSPGAWQKIPEPLQQTFIYNAPTWFDELKDPETLLLDLDKVSNFDKPALLTMGSESPPFFIAVLNQLTEAIPQAESKTFKGAGHAPHLNDPEQYVRTVKEFCLSKY